MSLSLSLSLVSWFLSHFCLSVSRDDTSQLLSGWRRFLKYSSSADINQGSRWLEQISSWDIWSSFLLFVWCIIIFFATSRKMREEKVRQWVQHDCGGKNKRKSKEDRVKKKMTRGKTKVTRVRFSAQLLYEGSIGRRHRIIFKFSCFPFRHH